MSEEMYKRGFTQIVNIDISQTVIKQMSEKRKEDCPQMKCIIVMKFKYLDQVMDVKKMEFPNESFNAVIDKGTLDTILVFFLNDILNKKQCGEKSAENAPVMLNEIYRVLTNTGTYICISYGAPQVRDEYFNNVLTANFILLIACIQMESASGESCKTDS